ncbi:PAS domain-containing sensor histidine kinase [Flavitalea sp.]|nr:PAS domain S-box protein [Flavitalea sp.]
MNKKNPPVDETFSSNDHMPMIDLRVFEAMPGNSILVAIDDPKFSILAVTDGMIQRAGLLKSAMINRPFFEPFPANPSNPDDPNSAGQNIVLDSFQHVIKYKAIHQLPIIRYDLENDQGNFTELYWKVFNKPVLDSEGNVIYIIHTSEDITALVKSERRDKELKAIEKQHQLFMQAPIAIQILKGPDLRVELANEPTFAIWGKGKDVIGKPLSEVMPELINAGYIEVLHHVRDSGDSYEAYEHPVKLPINNKEETKFFNLVCQPYYESDKSRAAGVLAFVSDVTDKMKAKRALRESHERFEAAIEAIQGVLWTNNAEGEMVGEQKGWAALTGQSFDEYQHYGWAQAVHPEDAAASIVAWNEAVRERKTFIYEHRVRMNDASWGTFSVRAIPLMNEDGSIREWVGVHTNITEQQKTEQQLRESEQRFRNLADDSPIFVFIIQPDALATVSYWNKTWLAYTGQTYTEALGRAWDGIIHPDDISIVMEHYSPAYQNRQSYFIPSVRVKRHDNKYRWHTFKGNPRYLPNGEFNGYVGVGFDIHEQKLAEEALKQSEERTRLAVEAARMGTFEINMTEQTMIYSARAAEIFELDTTKHWSYNVFTDAIYPDDRHIRNKAHEVAKATGELFYESRILQPDGSIRFVRLNGKYLYRDLTPFLIGTVIDITDEKKTADLLEQKINERTRELKQVNDKLRQFAYSASHDLQEPLRKIHILLDRLLMTLGQAVTDENKNIAKRIQQTTARMRLLIDDLLAYSNTTLGATGLEEIDLTEIVNVVVEDMEISIAEMNGKVHINPLSPVTGDKRQLRQLFQNLIDNSLKYRKKDLPPEIYINAGFVEGRDIKQFVPDILPDDIYHEITVKDNGIGFDPEDGDRIFNLFYRLHGREEYQGTGVGLAIVQKVVENHKGYIRAEGVAGVGAVFKIYLPAILL